MGSNQSRWLLLVFLHAGWGMNKLKKMFLMALVLASGQSMCTDNSAEMAGYSLEILLPEAYVRALSTMLKSYDGAAAVDSTEGQALSKELSGQLLSTLKNCFVDLHPFSADEKRTLYHDLSYERLYSFYNYPENRFYQQIIVTTIARLDEDPDCDALHETYQLLNGLFTSVLNDMTKGCAGLPGEDRFVLYCTEEFGVKSDLGLKYNFLIKPKRSEKEARAQCLVFCRKPDDSIDVRAAIGDLLYYYVNRAWFTTKSFLMRHLEEDARPDILRLALAGVEDCIIFDHKFNIVGGVSAGASGGGSAGAGTAGGKKKKNRVKKKK